MAALPVNSADVVVANQNVGKPRYTAAGAADWTGGALGDDVDQATANVAVGTASGAANYPDYVPRTQAAKAALPGASPPNAIAGEPDFVMVTDVARARGVIAPNQPYPKAGDPAPAAPVVTSIAPTTGAQASLPLLVTITGTGFTPWSRVFTGGAALPDNSAKYVDATHMTVPIWKASPGTVSVAVEDHDVLSNTNVLFTVT